MAFSSGKDAVLKADITVGGALTDVSAYIVSFDLDLPQDLLDTTTLSKSYRQRIPGLKDLGATINFLDDPMITAMLTNHFANVTASAGISFEFAPEGNTAASGKLKITAEMALAGFPTSSSVDGLATLVASYQHHSGTPTITTY